MLAASWTRNGAKSLPCVANPRKKMLDLAAMSATISERLRARPTFTTFVQCRASLWKRLCFSNDARNVSINHDTSRFSECLDEQVGQKGLHMLNIEPNRTVSARGRDASAFVAITSSLLASVEQNPELLSRVDKQMAVLEGEYSEELKAASVGREFLVRSL